MADILKPPAPGSSAAEPPQPEELKASEREVLVVGELSPEVVADIEAAEYGNELE